MLKITENQPLTPLDPFTCCEEEADYCHLFQDDENIYLQSTQEPCSCLECELWGDNEVTNSTFDIDETDWNLTGWLWNSGQLCITDEADGNTACTELSGFTVPNWYKVTFDVTITEGCVKVNIGGDYSEEITESGTYTVLLFAETSTLCFETCDEVNNILCIDNVYAYQMTCATLGEGWTPVEVTETKDTPSPNLVNGTFISTAGWLLGANSFLGANHVVVEDYLVQVVNIFAGEKYDLGFTITDFFGAGSIKVYLGGNLLDTITADGNYTYTEELTEIDNKELRFEATASTSKVSAVTLTGVQGWTRVIETKFCHDGSDVLVDPVTYTNFLPLDTLMQVELKIQGMTQGSVFMTVGSSNSDVFTSDGTYTRYLNSGSNQDLLITPSENFDGCVTLILTCLLRSDYTADLYTKDGDFVTNLDEFISYKDGWVTLRVDPKKICQMTACTESATDTFHGVTIDGVSYALNAPDGYDSMQENIIEAALNGNEFVSGIGQGTWDYSVSCGSQVATSDVLATHFTGIMLSDGTSYNINGGVGVLVTDVTQIQDWLDTLGLGTITYHYVTEGELTTTNNDNTLYIAGFYVTSPDTSAPAVFSCANPRYCLRRLSGEGTWEQAAWEVGGDTGIPVEPECERVQLADGCYYICMEDPCPDPPVYELVFEGDFSSQAAADAQGWIINGVDGNVAGGKYCGGLTADLLFIDLTAIYEDGQWYKIEFDATLTGGSGKLEFFHNADPDTILHFSESGHYELEARPSESFPFVVFNFGTLGASDVMCISNVKLYQGSPVTYCTPCFKYTQGEHECTKLITATDEGEQFGFNFDTGFKLQQRVDVERLNPFYPEDKQDYKFSSGVRSTVFAEGENLYVLRIGATPVNVHAALRLQKSLKNFIIDDVEYFAPEQEYRPEWGDPTSALAEAQITIRKKQGTLYKKFK